MPQKCPHFEKNISENTCLVQLIHVLGPISAWSRYGSSFGLSLLMKQIGQAFIIPPANFVCGGYTVFTLSVRIPPQTLFVVGILLSVHACVHPSVRP